MGPETVNKVKDGEIHGDFIGRDRITNIIMFQESEREFIVTHNANIKPVSYFTGRETELRELRQRIEDGRKSVLVSGMGGIGKTHICRKLFEEYVNQHADKRGEFFDHVGYIEYNGDMGSSLQSCLKFKQQDAPEQNQEAAWRELEYLAADGKLLLFVDNVDKPIREDGGLQRLKEIPGAVVLTSRQASFCDEFEPYRIGFLGMEHCRKIYEKIRFGDSRREIGAREAQDLEYVIEDLVGRHTITVELLAHLARTKLWSAERLRKELEQKRFRLEFHKDGKLVNIQESYEMLYDLSELTEAEKNVLEAFSVFPYIPLPAEVCNRWLLADAGVSENDDILMGLYRKGWLQFDMEQESYALHPVFAQFICAKCKPEAEKHARLIEACQESLEIPASGSALECSNYIPFAESILEKITMKEGMEQARFIAAVAYLLQYIAEYKRSEKLYEESLGIIERVLSKEHPDTATIYNNMAYVYGSQGEYKKAEELYEKALEIREQVLGEEHPDTATIYNNMAYVYDSQGKYRKAEELYEKALGIRERVLGEEHPDTATSYNNLAGVYKSQGEYRKAEELYEKALGVRERVLGEEHPDTAASYNNLAGVYDSQGEYKKAEELYKNALGIREKVLGEEHPDTAASYNNLACVYYSREEYKSAIVYYFKAYIVFLHKLGINHPNTKIIYNNMKLAYTDWNPNGDFKQWLKEKMEG